MVVRRDTEGRVIEVRGSAPQLVLSAFCDAYGRNKAPAVPDGVETSGSGYIGTFRQGRLRFAISMRQVGGEGWVAGGRGEAIVVRRADG
jgi:hypothetical protein